MSECGQSEHKVMLIVEYSLARTMHTLDVPWGTLPPLGMATIAS
ncbi:hypothetical protein ACVIYL_004814 [Bradyrhizobium sp. USDA 3315]